MDVIKKRSKEGGYIFMEGDGWPETSRTSACTLNPTHSILSSVLTLKLKCSSELTVSRWLYVLQVIRSELSEYIGQGLTIINKKHLNSGRNNGCRMWSRSIICLICSTI